MKKLRQRSMAPALLLFLLTLSAAAPPARAQEATFGEVIDVRVVNLEVVVTEKDRRVTDLGPEDFLLTVDGREVPIEYFTEVSGGTALLRTEESAEGAVPALQPGEPVPTSYLVFIDEYFGKTVDRNRVLNRMIEQLAFLAPGDRMAVVAFNGKRVEMLSSWSQSERELKQVLRQAQERKTFGLQRDAEQRLFESTRDLAIEPAQEVPDPSQDTFAMDIEERMRADELTAQVERAVLAATSALRSFAAPPGRKVMLLFSGGWPYNPAQWLLRDPARIPYTRAAARGEDIYQSLTETANRLSYTVYPVDVPGLDAENRISADRATPDIDFENNRFGEREREEEATLYNLARETGGEALVDGAAYDVFQRVYEDTRSYYWIGFTPSWQGDDSEHKVKIDTRNKAHKLRARKGFSDLSRETEVTMMVESSLLFGDPPGASPLGAVIGKGERAGRGKVNVPLKITIPLDSLTFLPVEGGFVADTELRVAVLDEDGNTSEIPVVPLEFKTRTKPGQGKMTVYQTQMKLRRKKSDLVVSIYDKPSGKILSTKISVDPEVGKN